MGNLVIRIWYPTGLVGKGYRRTLRLPNSGSIEARNSTLIWSTAL
ncbi:MAG: hypothetical protein ACYC56_07125 [Candidatus Aquicultor sp.]